MMYDVRFGALVAIGLWILPSAGFAIEGKWIHAGELPERLLGLHANAVNEKIYIVGGSLSASLAEASRRVSSNTHIFDPVSGSWSLGADVPTPRGFLGTAVVDGKIYAIGGSPNMIEHDPATASVEVYDTSTDTWNAAPAMPTARADLTASAVDGKIYAIGGTRHVGVDALATVEMYDPASRAWASKAPMPTPRLHLTSAVVDGKIYVIGGGPEWPVPLPTLEIYDPATDTWSRGSDMPTARIGIWCAVLDGKIYVVGGLSWENEALSTVEVYDPKTDNWESAPDMPTPRFLLAAETVNHRVYVLGGASTDYTRRPAVEAFTKE